MYDTLIKERMTKNVISIHIDSDFYEACRLFRQINVHHLPVTNDRREVIGMISSGDMVNAISVRLPSLKNTQPETVNAVLPIDQVMSSQPFTLSPNDDMEQAINLLSQHYFHAIPIVDEAGVLQGILTNNDIVDFIAENMKKVTGYRA